MDLGYDIGDTVIHRQERVIGKVIKTYFPTACNQQTMILCDDGRKFHAPSDEFVKIPDEILSKFTIQQLQNIDISNYRLRPIGSITISTKNKRNTVPIDFDLARLKYIEKRGIK